MSNTYRDVSLVLYTPSPPYELDVPESVGSLNDVYRFPYIITPICDLYLRLYGSLIEKLASATILLMTSKLSLL